VPCMQAFGDRSSRSSADPGRFEIVPLFPGGSSLAPRSHGGRWKRVAFLATVLVIGVLLGRAVILETLTPCALAAYAASHYLRRGASLWMATGLVVGAVSAVGYGANPLLVVSMLLAYRLLLFILARRERLEVNHVPFVVFAVDTGFRLGFAGPLSGWTLYGVGMAFADGALGFLLATMFLQMPALIAKTRPHLPLRFDETIAVVILLASVLTGLRGVGVDGVQAAAVVADFVVLVFAVIGGGAIGGAVGVVCGVVLTLGLAAASPLIGVLAFAGVLAGLLRPSGKLFVGVGFLLGTVALSLYVLPGALVYPTFAQAAIALAAFYIVPQRAFRTLARFVPGTDEYAVRKRDFARRTQLLMAARIRSVGDVFAELAATFAQSAEPPEGTADAGQKVVALACADLCKHCRKFGRCWEDEEQQTRVAMGLVADLLFEHPDLRMMDMPLEMQRRCIKPQELLRSLRRGMIIVRREWAIREELQESRALLGEQLGGMAAIMQELAADVGRDKQESDARELRINEALMRLGLEVQGIDIVSLEEGRVAIDIFTLASGGADACSKIVAPLLSDILGETIVVSCEQTTDDGQFVRVTVTSARRYDVRSGAASVARDGRLENGDSFCLIDVGRGRFAIALSDGMGNGQRANRESTVAVGLLEQLLRAGFDETVAIKTVNSVLLLRFPDEMYATLDLAVIDLYSLRTELLKVGSVSTYVKRGRKVLRLEGESIPIGMLREVEIARQQIALQERDLLVFISDGILACVGRMDDPGDWVRRQLERFDTTDPQALADLLLETAVRAGGGEIRDDMTVLCARIDRFTPKWATISRPDVPRIKTQRKPRNPAPREKRERLVQV